MICCRRAVTRDALELPQTSILDERHLGLTLSFACQKFRPCGMNVAEVELSVHGCLQLLGFVGLNGLQRGAAWGVLWWVRLSKPRNRVAMH
jgi:hypothetical protein